MTRILIVDDEEEDRLLLRAILDPTGHELFFAKNGEEAIKAYFRQQIGVVVTDLQMPQGDGMEVIEAIRGMDPDAFIVVVSGTGEGELQMAGIIGADVTLAKPVDPLDLLNAVSSANR